MEKIDLCVMTRELCHELYKNWENDPALYAEPTQFAPYRYDEGRVDRYYGAKQDPSRVLFAILRDARPIGELQLKQIDRERKTCTLSIHMQNDTVKGRGYGTCAEWLALEYAFTVLDMAVVYADTIIQNTRSQHVLEKVGFQWIGERDGFWYYRYVRPEKVRGVDREKNARFQDTPY